MKSPFPGMDPYLEQHWRDVHASLVLYTRNQIQPQLGPQLRARVEERLVIDSVIGDRDHGIYPDVRVVERAGKFRPASPIAGSVAIAEPLVIHLPDETHTEGFLQIIDTSSGNEVVTVVEILSPTNKRSGAAQVDYRRKQEELRDGGVSLVEIDLLRAGKRVLQVSEYEIPPSQRMAYAACVHRGYKRDRFEYYGMALRLPLPAIRIPLREADEDVVLNIQSLVDQAYADGAYDDLDYSKPPTPPLTAEDDLWADELLRAAGRR